MPTEVLSRILLADDSPHAQRMGERILREEGYQVVSVTDGETALKRLDDVDPDLIVADVFLPGVDGFELCRRVKAQPGHQHVRVVMTAGMLEVFDEDEARRAGADAIIKKPFEASVVIETVKPLAADANRARNPLPPSAPAPAEHAPEKPPAPFVVVVEPERPSPDDDYVPEPELELLDEYEQEPVPPPPAFAPMRERVTLGPTPVPVPMPAPLPLPTIVPAAAETPAPPLKDLDPELVRAAVTVALDEALPALIDDITERVIAALRKNQ